MIELMGGALARFVPGVVGHCHLLSHEGKGMMATTELTGGDGAD